MGYVTTEAYTPLIKITADVPVVYLAMFTMDTES